jgi:hypothetical protein
MQTPLTNPSCSCGHRGREKYSYLHGLYVYDVDRAKEIVRDGRAAVPIAEESVRQCVEEAHLNDVHLGHVEPTMPGIIAIFTCHTEDDELLRTHLLIDGHHRAARCLQLGQPFQAYLLSEEESAAILLQKPPGRLRRQDLRGE